MADPDPPDHPGARATRQMNPEAFSNLTMAIAALERLGPWYTQALKLGTLALIQATVRELAQSDATRAQVTRLRELTAALAQMPFDR